MPDRKLSPEAVQAVTAPETAAVFITLLAISVDGSVVLRLADDRQEVVSGGETYTPWAFTAQLPEQGEDGNKALRLEIDNTDAAIWTAIKGAAGKRITCTVSVVLSTSPDTVEQGPLEFILRNVTANAQAVSAELYDGYMADRNFTSLAYTPSDFPGLFF